MASTRMTVPQLCEVVGKIETRMKDLEARTLRRGCGVNGHPLQQPMSSDSAAARLIDSLREAIDEVEKVVARPALPRQIQLEWPKSLARALLVAGCTCEAAVKEAVKRYLNGSDDFEAGQQLVALHEGLMDEDDPRGLVLRKCLERVLTGNRRSLREAERTLDDLRIHVKQVRVGDAVHHKFHEPVGEKPAESEEQVDTVAEVLTPLFAWRDESGQPQVIESKVVVYSAANRSPRADGKSQSNGKPKRKARSIDD